MCTLSLRLFCGSGFPPISAPRSKVNVLRTRFATQAVKPPPSDELKLFHEVARALTSNLELEPLLRTILGKMEEFFGPERWSLLMVDEETGDLEYALTTGRSSVKPGTRLRPGEGIAGWVARTGEPLVIPDVRLDRDWSRFAREHPELNLHSIACLPLRHGGRTLGVLQLHNSKLDLLPDSSLSFLRVLCDYAAIALENARQVNLVHRLTVTDDCTGLFNARFLYTTLEEEITAAMRPSLLPSTFHFSLLFFDLDRFKSVNDTYGHLVGSPLARRGRGPSSSGRSVRGMRPSATAVTSSWPCFGDATSGRPARPPPRYGRAFAARTCSPAKA